MSLMESSVDDALFFKILSSDDSFEFRLATACPAFVTLHRFLI